MHFWIRVVDIAVLVRICAAHKDKQLLVLDCTIEDLAAVSEPPSEEALLIVACCGDAYQELIRILKQSKLKTKPPVSFPRKQKSLQMQSLN